MAKRKGGESKSQAIRDMLADDPHAKTAEIVSALGAKGIKVSQNLVYLIKSKSREKKRRAKRQKAVAASRNSGHTDPVALVVEVRHLAVKAGGMKRLKELVDILAE
jgi:arginine repressor